MQHHTTGVLKPQFLLHGFGILLEAFAAVVVQRAQTTQEIVGERVAIGFALERFTGPAVAIIDASIELLQAMDEPGLLLFEHFHVSIVLLDREGEEKKKKSSPFGIHLVMGLLPLAKHANGIVGFAATTRTGTIALTRPS